MIAFFVLFYFVLILFERKNEFDHQKKKEKEKQQQQKKENLCGHVHSKATLLHCCVNKSELKGLRSRLCLFI